VVAECIEDCVERGGQLGDVAVVDPAVDELVGQVLQ
jgi:hypothetical protein